MTKVEPPKDNKKPTRNESGVGAVPTIIPDEVREKIQQFGNAIADLHRQFNSDDKREKLNWEIFDARCKYEENQLLEYIKLQQEALLDRVEASDLPKPIFDWQPEPVPEQHRNKWYRIGFNAAVAEQKAVINKLRLEL